MRRILLLVIALFFINLSSFAQSRERYSRAKIYLDEAQHTFRDLAGTGIAVDHGDYKKNTWFISDFSASELAAVKKAGYKVEILIGDVSKHYADQNKKKVSAKTTSVSCSAPAVPIPSHFHLGTYAGGFFSYTELLAILDSMQTLYPGLISVRQAIGTYQTIEGRPIYWVRMSNNPSVDQPAKPQMLYTALHHAREPGSISQLIYYMWYMLENYSTNDQVKKIIDNTELYFVPCMNVDGYLYNIANDPFGGGMWRKNRRNNMDGTFGVDLNRNYGYFWGFDDFGSSPLTSSDTYRGTAGFSEPETQAIKWLCDQHKFRLAVNYHTYQNDVIYPWGYQSILTPDSTRFFNVAQFITEDNKYRFGTCYEVLNYLSNGSSDDWMYGDVATKPAIYAMTPEVGKRSNGFYPPTGDIIPDCQANLQANLNAATLLLPFAHITCTDKKIQQPGPTYLHYDFRRIGFPDTATYTVSLVPLDSWLSTTTPPKVYTNPASGQVISDSFACVFTSSGAPDQLVTCAIKVDNGLYSIYDTVQFHVGWFIDVTTPGTSALTGWVNSGWGISTTEYHTAPACIHSSLVDGDNYPDNSSLTIAIDSPVRLTYALQAYLNFYAKWNLETGNDFVFAEAAPVGSSMWQPLCGKYTRPDEITSEPMYDGMQNQWVREEIDLGDYLGQSINIRFRLESDPGLNYKGFFFDDLDVTYLYYREGAVNGPAPLPVSVYPNPAKDELTIAGTAGQQLTAIVTDCLGRQVLAATVKGIQTLNTASLPAGIYCLRLTDLSGTATVRKVSIVR